MNIIKVLGKLKKTLRTLDSVRHSLRVNYVRHDVGLNCVWSENFHGCIWMIWWIGFGWLERFIYVLVLVVLSARICSRDECYWTVKMHYNTRLICIRPLGVWFPHRQRGPLRESSSLQSLIRWGLGPRPALVGLAQFTAKAFNRLERYAISPGLRPAVTQNSPFLPYQWRHYSFRLPTEGWPGWVGLGV